MGNFIASKPIKLESSIWSNQGKLSTHSLENGLEKVIDAQLAQNAKQQVRDIKEAIRVLKVETGTCQNMSSHTKIKKDLKKRVNNLEPQLDKLRKHHVILNTYVNSYHEKLCIDSKTADPMVPKAAQNTLIDYGCLQKEILTHQGKDLNPIKEAKKLTDGVKLEHMYKLNQVKAGVDTGHGQSMYSRLLAVAQEREGFVADEMELYRMKVDAKHTAKLIQNNSKDALNKRIEDQKQNSVKMSNILKSSGQTDMRRIIKFYTKRKPVELQQASGFETLSNKHVDAYLKTSSRQPELIAHQKRIKNPLQRFRNQTDMATTAAASGHFGSIVRGSSPEITCCAHPAFEHSQEQGNMESMLDQQIKKSDFSRNINKRAVNSNQSVKPPISRSALGRNRNSVCSMIKTADNAQHNHTRLKARTGSTLTNYMIPQSVVDSTSKRCRSSIGGRSTFTAQTHTAVPIAPHASIKLPRDTIQASAIQKFGEIWHKLEQFEKPAKQNQFQKRMERESRKCATKYTRARSQLAEIQLEVDEEKERIGLEIKANIRKAKLKAAKLKMIQQEKIRKARMMGI